jgi:hypothetical protein
MLQLTPTATYVTDVVSAPQLRLYIIIDRHLLPTTVRPRPRSPSSSKSGPAVQRLHVRPFERPVYQAVSPSSSLETHYDAASCDASPVALFVSAVYLAPIAESEKVWSLSSPELWSVDVNTLERRLILTSSSLRLDPPYVAYFIHRLLGVAGDAQRVLTVLGMRRPVDGVHEVVDYSVFEYDIRTGRAMELARMLNAFL